MHEDEDWEPECTCQQIDVDKVDVSGCELHDPNSPRQQKIANEWTHKDD